MYSGKVTVGRKENGLKKCCPVVRWQISVRNGNWDRGSARVSCAFFSFRDYSLHWQKRVLALRGTVIGDPKLIANLPEVDAIDCFNEERQAVRVRLPLFVGMFIIEAVTEHVLFIMRA